MPWSAFNNILSNQVPKKIVEFNEDRKMVMIGYRADDSGGTTNIWLSPNPLVNPNDNSQPAIRLYTYLTGGVERYGWTWVRFRKSLDGTIVSGPVFATFTGLSAEIAVWTAESYF